MPNLHRGEVEGCLDGRAYTLCLTLGALAELESAFGADDMMALARRFEAGRLSARDCVRILGAGLRGAGHDLADDAIARMQAEGGAAGYVAIVARLLTATFGSSPSPRHSRGEGMQPPDASAPTAAARTGEVTEPRPFPGTT